MKDMTTILILHVQVWLIVYTYIDAEVSAIIFCEESAMTVRYVERCPEDLKSWENAAKNMNCESIRHNCSLTLLSKGQHFFQYHCVINTFINATLEVCAPNRFILGYCTEYNLMGRVIQENYNADCTKHYPPCPAFYDSAEAYKYQTCYDLVRKNRRNTEFMDKQSQNPDLRSTSERLTGNVALIFLSMFHKIHERVLRISF